MGKEVFIRARVKEAWWWKVHGDRLVDRWVSGCCVKIDQRLVSCRTV